MSKKTVVIELDFTYTPNEEDVYVYLKELIKDRSLSWEFKKDDEIEQLRELADAGKEDRKAIDELVDENLRLRELLEKALVYSHSMPTTLVAAIEKEVGDE